MTATTMDLRELLEKSKRFGGDTLRRVISL
jgi:hypothetical protein